RMEFALGVADREARFDLAHGGAGDDRYAPRARPGEERRDQTRRIEEAVSRVERSSTDAVGADEWNHRGDLGGIEPSRLHAEPTLELAGVAQPAFARLRAGQHEVAGLMEAQAPDGPFQRLQLRDREP